MATIALLTSLIVIYAAGTYTDRGLVGPLIKLGSRLNALLHLLRLGARTFPAFVVVNVTTEISRNIFMIPWHANFYNLAQTEGALEYVLIMQVGLDVARIIFWAILFGLSFSLALPLVLKIGFVLAAFASLLIPLTRIGKAQVKA